MLDPVAEAMAFAHSLGVVHRDLNPSNLFVVVLPDGTQRLKVVDFGVAKVLSDNALQLLNRAATLGSLRMFTPVYGAPEQFSETFGKISPATDVYAFALLVVELLLDRSPVEGDNLTDLMMKATDTVLRPTPWSLGCTTVGESVEIAMTRALHVDPTKRHADIGAFWGALKHAISQDEELSKRRASQPPAALSVPGPKTKKGTLIIRPEANTFADAPSTSSIFAEGSTSSRAQFPESSTASGPRGTLQMQVYSGGEPGASERAPGSSERQPGSSGVGERAITIRPPTTGAEADPLGQTQSGAPRRGTSPLSFTMQPGQDLFSPEQRALVEQQEAQRNAPSTPPPTLNATLSSGAGSRTSERPPVAPELAVTPSSVPRWLLVVLGLGGLGALVAGGWVISRMLAP
jgi:serine/threonine-protein kinase